MLAIVRKSLVVLAAVSVLALAPLTPLAAAPDSGDGSDRWITVRNNSEYRVWSIVYGVPGGTYYTRDLLGEAYLDPEGKIDIKVDDGSGRCGFWIKALTKSGSIKWEKFLNVCQESSFTLER